MNTTENPHWLSVTLAAIVIIHFVNLLWHGAAHKAIPVPLSALQTAFVVLIIFLLPLIGVVLLPTGHRSAGAVIITLSMLGSLLFGFINHFMRVSPDYVLELPPDAWRHSFVLSAALLVVTETIATLVGAVAIWAWRPTA